jgi:hypothetical protein
MSCLWLSELVRASSVYDPKVVILDRAVAPRCPFCNGKIMFRPCPCIRGAIEFGLLQMVDGMRMVAEMTIFFETLEPPTPVPDDWPTDAAGLKLGHWVPTPPASAWRTAECMWHRRLGQDSGSLMLPFFEYPNEGDHWYACIYTNKRITEWSQFTCTMADGSPSHAMHWADERIGRPTSWERL